MDDMRLVIQKVQQWINSLPVEEPFNIHQPIVSISKPALVFFSVNTETSGRFVDILDLTIWKGRDLKEELEKRLAHIERIGKKHLRKTA